MTPPIGLAEQMAESAGPGPRLPELRPQRRDDWRLMLLVAGFVLIYATLGLRMGMTALVDPSEPGSDGAGQHAEPVRGRITDRHGTLMAANLPAWALYVHPREIRDREAAAQALAPIFPDLDAAEIRARLDPARKFAWIARPVTPRQKQAVMELSPAIPALRFGRRDMRVYPQGRLAAHVLGGTGTGVERVNSAELVGLSGAELHFDARLRDPALIDVPLALSIDLRVQSAMTQVLARGMKRMGAKWAAGLLMDVRTGEILAMASLPDYDPGAPVARVGGGEDNPRFNRLVSGVYELGSVFKPITAAVALDAGVITPESLIETGSPIYFGRQRIRDMHAMPATLSVADVIRRSSNIGAARIALRLGTSRFRDYLDRLGMLEPVEVELGEARAGKPMVPPRWSEISTATISFGHGLAISPLHLAAAFATLANGGRRVVPSLVPGGQPLGEQVLSPRVSAQILAMLRKVVTNGTGRRTDIPGYEVGGKTGTANKVRPGGGYYHDRVLASFVSVFPVSDPAYVMLVMLDEPTDPESGKREAGRTAVPVTADAIRRIAPLVGLRPLEPEAPAAEGRAQTRIAGGRP